MPDQWSILALEEHNKLRAKHGNTPKLELDPLLTMTAQEWAEKCAKSGELKHAEGQDREINGEFGEEWGKCGENLAMAEGRFNEGDEDKAALWAITTWYTQKNDYDFETGKPNEPGRNIDYFTQLVWDESTKLGMGVAFNGNKVYVVGRYIKRGNTEGGYLDHVRKWGSGIVSRKARKSRPSSSYRPTRSSSNRPLSSRTRKSRWYYEYIKNKALPKKTLNIYFSDVVYGIEFEGKMFGKKRGYKKCITLDGGEYITSATWMEVKFPATNAVATLRLSTNYNREYKFFGSHPGGSFKFISRFEKDEFHKTLLISGVNGELTGMKGAQSPRVSRKARKSRW